MKPPPPNAFKVVLTTIVTLVVVGVLVKLTLPNYLKSKITTEIQQSCPTCKIKIDSLQIHFMKSAITFNGVEFTSDPTIVTTVDFKAPLVFVDFKLASLFSNAPVIKKIELSHFQIVVADDEAKPPNKGPINYRWIEGLPPFSVDEMILNQSEFEYMFKTRGREAKILVHKIDVTISAFGTRQNISPRFVEWEVKALLEKSGAVHMKSKVDLFETKNEDDLMIDIKELHLPELDHFFGIEDGVTLEGQLHHARTQLHISEGLLTGTLELFYKDLDLKYERTAERGKIKNFLSNLISSATISKRRPSEPGLAAPVVQIRTRRYKNEGLIKFLLRGLQKGAMDILSRKDQRKREISSDLPH